MAENILGNCEIQLWSNREYTGKTTGPLEGPGEFKLHDYNKMKDEAKSLMTGPNTWAKCFDDKNSFEGAYLPVGPNTQIPDLQEWNAIIGAIELFDSKPSGFED